MSIKISTDNRISSLALNYLSYKARTEKEVYDKLCSIGEFDEEAIQSEIIRLKDAGLIDDISYAESFALFKANRRLDGKNKVKGQLFNKGIRHLPSYEDLGIDEVSNALTLIKRKMRYVGDLDGEGKRKITEYLSRKGYSFSDINAAFEGYCPTE